MNKTCNRWQYLDRKGHRMDVRDAPFFMFVWFAYVVAMGIAHAPFWALGTGLAFMALNAVMSCVAGHDHEKYWAQQKQNPYIDRHRP